MNKSQKMIPIEKLHPFENHPYKVQDNEEMELLAESIRQNGLLAPVLVRPLENTTDEYEIISGHRRIMASQKAGITEVSAFVVSLDRNAAAIALVDSNLHREHILPSEKAFAYKLKVEALKRQGQRTDLTSSQVATKLDTATEIGKAQGESRDMVYRYIRLTHLISEILQYVDDGRIAFTPAVELSYLTEGEQRILLEQMEIYDCTPSLSQACRMKRLSRAEELSTQAISIIMGEEKANQKERLKIPIERIRKFFPKHYTVSQMEEEIVKMCESRSRLRSDRNAR